jgi:hypothetical protein
MTDWVALLSNPSAGATALITSLLFAVLRAITTTPGGIQVVFNKPGQVTNSEEEKK